MVNLNRIKPTSLSIDELEEDFQDFLETFSDVSIWAGRQYFDFNKHKYFFLLKKMEQHNLSGKNVLDVGCGSCIFDYILMKRGFSITGCDYYDNKIIRSFSRKSGIPYFQFNLNSDNSFPQKFDVILCSEVLEHTNINLKNGIKKLLNACHQDSILIITLPNIYSINNIIRIIRGENIVEDFPDTIVMKDDIILDMRHHKRECTKKDLLNAAAANNLQLIESGNCYTSTPFTHPVLAKVIPPFLKAHIYGIFKISSSES